MHSPLLRLFLICIALIIPSNLEARGFGSGNIQELKNCKNKKVVGGRVVCRDKEKQPNFTNTKAPVRNGSIESLKNCKNKKVVGKRVKCMDSLKKEQAEKQAVL